VPSPTSISISNDTLFAATSGSLQWYLNGSPILGATDSVYVAWQVGNYTVGVVGSNGCTSASNSIATGIENSAMDTNAFILFPNPTTGKFYFSLDDINSAITTINITDLGGRNVYEKVYYPNERVNGLFYVNCEHLTAGTYIVSFKDKRGVTNKKLTVKKD